MFGLKDVIVRFDMFEYNDCIVVFKLIGVIVGYVGYDDNSNILIECICWNFYFIVFFDEIEKVDL